MSGLTFFCEFCPLIFGFGILQFGETKHLQTTCCKLDFGSRTVPYFRSVFRAVLYKNSTER